MPQVTNKTCGRCAMTIPAAAQVCPYCGLRVIEPAVAKGCLRFLFFLMMAFFVLLLIGACLPPSSPETCWVVNPDGHLTGMSCDAADVARRALR